MSNLTGSTPDLTASAAVPPSRPVGAPADVAARSAATAQPGLIAPVRRSGSPVVLGVIGVVLVSVVALLVAVYLVTGLGGDAFALGGIMALVPLTIVFLGVRWIDRWEPEPRLAVLFAFLWGAAVAVVIALVVGAEIDTVVTGLGGPGPGYEFFGAAIQAPIVEETGKGLGVLLIFWVARRYFDGPVDGVVYAAWVAGGFAFTENILYFGSQLVDSGGVDGTVIEIFLIRGIMSPFAHEMFTACTGIALGYAARRTGAVGAIGFFLIGLIPAILLHGLWNGALFFVSDFFGYYLVVQVPLFIMAVLLVRFLRRQESRLTRDRLSEYAAAGWISPQEIDALATPQGRRQALAWAATNGKRKAMKRYIRDATRLAFARQRIITGRDRIGAGADEAILLGAILESRRSLIAAGTR